MFENLTDRLSQTLRHVTGKAKLTIFPTALEKRR